MRKIGKKNSEPIVDWPNNEGLKPMPYVSAAQRGWAHTPEGTKALGGPAKIAEWDAASKGKKLPEKKTMSNPGFAKGGDVQVAHYAAGGPVLGRTGDWKKTVPNKGFLDTPDRFTAGRKVQGAPGSEKTDENWGKGSSKANPRAVDKSEKAVTPRT